MVDMIYQIQYWMIYTYHGNAVNGRIVIGLFGLTQCHGMKILRSQTMGSTELSKYLMMAVCFLIAKHYTLIYILVHV